MRSYLVEIEFGILINVESEVDIKLNSKVTGETASGWLKQVKSGLVKKVY